MSTLRGNREILRVEDVSVTLGAGRRRGMSTGNRVLQRVNLTIEAGSWTAIVGPNGAGKSTLVKMLLGDEEPTSGRVQWGSNIRHAYFSQHAAESLDLKISVLETLGLAMPTLITPRKPGPSHPRCLRLLAAIIRLRPA